MYSYTDTRTYMLAQIAEEIHAPDRAAAAQDTGEGGSMGLEVDDDDPTDS